MNVASIVKSIDIATIKSEIDCGKVGYIYFITNPEAETVKVGYATDVNKRKESLQTGNHVELLLYSGFPAARHTERVIHRAIEKFKIFNEWFRHNSEVDELILCFEDLLDDRDDYDTPLSPDEVVFVIDDWQNSYGRGRSSEACGNNVDNEP